eukprot:14197529-Ditylum_brightwellii.AAC.1
MLAALDDIYSKVPKDATIVSGEDVNAKLGRNIWFKIEDNTSPHPFHKVTGPFSAHIHNNTCAGPIVEKLAAYDLTFTATWLQSNS